MQFTLATVLALAAAALAQTAGFDAISKPTEGENVPAGKAYPVTWEYSTKYAGTVTLTLLGGASSTTLEKLSTIQSGVDNSKGTYSWVVDSTLGSAAVYGIQITLDSDSSVFQYSFPFHITAGSASATSASSTGSASVTSASATSAPATSTSSAAASSTTVANVTETSATKSSTSSSSSSVIATTHVSNTTSPKATTLSTATGGSAVTLTSTQKVGSTSVSATSTATGVVITSGATARSSSLLALVGGLTLAIFAL